MLPLKLEILLKGIILSVGLFHLLLIGHIKKQMQTSDLVLHCLDLSVAIQLWMIKIN